MSRKPSVEAQKAASDFDARCARMREQALEFRRTIRRPEPMSRASRMRVEVTAK